MATIPSQRTFVTGEVVTAAELNSNVRDAVNFLLNPPHAEIYSNANQSISATTTTQVGLNAITEDNDSMAIGGSSLTIKTPGRYLLQAQVSWDGTTSGGRGIFLGRYTTTTSYLTSVTTQADASDQTRMQTVRTYRFNQGDAATLWAWTSVAASLITNNYGNSFLSASFVGS